MVLLKFFLDFILFNSGLNVYSRQIDIKHGKNKNSPETRRDKIKPPEKQGF